MNLPRRITLVEQVVDILRRDLFAGRWPHRLPGEHYLSDQLEVSRSTLRAALDVLQREGLVHGGRGQRRRLSRRLENPAPSPSSIIGVISSLPLHRHSAHSIIILHELQRHLQRAGFELQLRVVPQSIRSAGRRKLQMLVEQTRAACWILSSCSIELQSWFANREAPTLVQGSCHVGVDLPFVRCDAAAACRHAVGLLRAKGHRRIGLLLPRSSFAGTLEIAESFAKACEGLPRGETLIRFHDGDAAAVERAVLAMMRPTPRLTAFLAMMPGDALATFCHLLSRGYRVPQDMSVMAIFDEPILSFLIPRLSRYSYDDYYFARRMARVVIRMAKHGGCPRSISTVPNFIGGATVGPPSSATAKP